MCLFMIAITHSSIKKQRFPVAFYTLIAYIVQPMRPWLSWIERCPPEAEVIGSNPIGRANKIKGLTTSR